MRLWSDARGWSNWVRGSWMRQDTPPLEQESLPAFTTDGGNPGLQNLHRHWSLPLLLPPIPSPSSPRPLLLRNGRQHSVSRIEVLTTHFLLSFDRQNEICAAAKKVGGRGRSTKAFAWESSWGQREKSKRREGVESKKAAIKAHNKDNDRRETQDLSRRLT